jgi:hypothetical protein
MSAPAPELAAWLLRTFGSGASIEALVGDLTEEYHAGRNRLWFWWQALAGIVVTFFAEEDQAMRRYLSYLLLPTLACAAITGVLTRSYLPTQYKSETVILIVPQRVPESFVHPTMTSRIEDRLQALSQQVMSRTRLERIIKDFNLYQTERNTGKMEDVVRKMRNDIDIKVVPGNACRISFHGDDPRTVMKVTERLASLFIEENLRDREVLAEGTTQFINAQLEDARRQIITKENEMQQMRARGAAASISEADVLENEVLRDTFKTLLVKRQEAIISANLERRQIASSSSCSIRRVSRSDRLAPAAVRSTWPVPVSASASAASPSSRGARGDPLNLNAVPTTTHSKPAASRTARIPRSMAVRAIRRPGLAQPQQAGGVGRGSRSSPGTHASGSSDRPRG